jgi:hypothetical protein
MNHQTDKTGDIFAVVLRDIPTHHEPMVEGIDTAAFLINLAHHWPFPLNVDQERGLAAICRALSISKQVRLCYDPKWKRALRREPLEPIYWPVMIAVLSAQFQRNNESDDEAKGEQLKRLNAALTALDIADELDDIPHLLELRPHLEGRLNSILHS